MRGTSRAAAHKNILVSPGDDPKLMDPSDLATTSDEATTAATTPPPASTATPVVETSEVVTTPEVKKDIETPVVPAPKSEIVSTKRSWGVKKGLLYLNLGSAAVGLLEILVQKPTKNYPKTSPK